MAVASNYSAVDNIASAIDLIRGQFGDVAVSNAYRNQSMNPQDSDYINLVIGFDSQIEPEEVVKHLKVIERKLGRNALSKKRQQISIDLDLLIYGDYVGTVCNHQIPRGDILTHSFILGPLAELAGTKLDSVSGSRYQDLWQQFDKHQHPLQIVQL